MVAMPVLAREVCPSRSVFSFSICGTERPITAPPAMTKIVFCTSRNSDDLKTPD